jgi:hypothetical protein
MNELYIRILDSGLYINVNNENVLRIADDDYRFRISPALGYVFSESFSIYASIEGLVNALVDSVLFWGDIPGGAWIFFKSWAIDLDAGIQYRFNMYGDPFVPPPHETVVVFRLKKSSLFVDRK